MNNLKQIKLLGEGAFGKCYLCESPEDGSQYVVKQIDISKMSQQEKKEAYHEAKVMSAFDHPNIIKFIDVYTTTNGKLNIVMNYADGGDLSSKIKVQRGRLFKESEIVDIFVQVCLAIKHVHDRKVLHRDIKGQNIFLMKSGMIKLGDFGISKVLTNTVDKARTMVGTPYYLSPEIIENRPYSFKSDVWSLGVLLYELCTLKPPFDGTSIRHLGLNIVRGIYPPIPPHFSKDMKQLIAQMLTVDANRRPTVAQILRMPFIKGRIQGLLTESKQFEEFSHTILHKKNLFAPKQEVKKELPKPEPKKELPKPEVKKEIPLYPKIEPKIEPPRQEVKKEIPIYPKIEVPRQEVKKEMPRPEFKKEPPRPEVKKEPEINREIQKKILQEPKNFYVPKQKIEPNPNLIVRNEPKIYQVQEVKRFNERDDVKKIINDVAAKLADKDILKYQRPQPQNCGKLEDFFKPVEKSKKNEEEALAREELRKKKEAEVKKKLEEAMQKRENEKMGAIAKKEAAQKKRDERIQKINEAREKMKNDIKNKKNSSIQPLVEWPNTPVAEEKKIIDLEYPSVDEKNSYEENFGSESIVEEKNIEKASFSFGKNTVEENLLTEDKKATKEKPKPKYAEQRKKMINEIRNKPKPKQSDFVIEWVGVRNPEEKRLYEVLQDAIKDESLTSETNDSNENYMDEIPQDEEVVDRVDEIDGKEIIPLAKIETSENTEKHENEDDEDDEEEDIVGSTYNSLEAMREFLEEKMGCKMLIEAYNIMKEIGDLDPLECGYTPFYEKLKSTIPVEHMEEYVSYLRTLIIIENNAESYLDGLVRKKYN